MSASCLTKHSPTPTRRSRQQPLRSRTQSLLGVEIDFIANPDFAHGLDSNDPLVDELLESDAEPSNAPSDLPAHLRRICESALLSHEQEVALFRAMNYHKFRAAQLQSELDADCPDPQAVRSIEAALERAQRIRDHLIKANMRLVMSIVKKFVTPQQSYDEMLSEGVMTLMRAVEKFDFDRGFRFSTYAYRSIARSAYRSVAAARTEEARFTRDAEDWAFEAEEERSLSTMNERAWQNLRELMGQMLHRLDRRERFIIRSRYALGSHRKVRTFQLLADKLGVSKERVRQLEQRAVKKLQAMAADFEPDEIAGPALM